MPIEGWLDSFPAEYDAKHGNGAWFQMFQRHGGLCVTLHGWGAHKRWDRCELAPLSVDRGRYYNEGHLPLLEACKLWHKGCKQGQPPMTVKVLARYDALADVEIIEPASRAGQKESIFSVLLEHVGWIPDTARTFVPRSKYVRTVFIPVEPEYRRGPSEATLKKRKEREEDEFLKDVPMADLRAALVHAGKLKG